ncbi:MAG: thiamine-phosphate kinase [Pseudomonadota bacterium]
MALSEFELIQRYFDYQPAAGSRDDVVLGIGDDAAILAVPDDRDLVVCMDTLVTGVHFPESVTADAIGHKALAVNLSDLAAMGAEPAWFTLSLTLPDADSQWLELFAQGLFALADRYHVQLVGGDVTRGPLNITVQAHGLVPKGRALKRSGAAVGDRIYVTGTLGDAGLALQQGSTASAGLRQRLDYPEPRIDAGLALRGLVSACIDISDGLLADLGHLLAADGLGAILQVDDLPRSQDFLATMETLGDSGNLSYNVPLSAGDDYELCFTVPPGQGAELESALAALPGSCTAIGVIEQGGGLRCQRQDGSIWQPAANGYQHFRAKI